MKIFAIIASLIMSVQASSEDLIKCIKNGGHTAVVKFFESHSLSEDQTVAVLNEAFQKHDPRVINLVLNHIPDDAIFINAVTRAYEMEMKFWFSTLIPQDHSVHRINLILATLKSLKTKEALEYYEDIKLRFDISTKAQ